MDDIGDFQAVLLMKRADKIDKPIAELGDVELESEEVRREGSLTPRP